MGELTRLAGRLGAGSELLEARGLSKRYAPSRWHTQSKIPVAALADVSLTLRKDSVLALVGESGAGKSTLGRCLARLEEPDSGAIRFAGRDLLKMPAREAFAARRSIQFIFQDSGAAINPRFTALEVVDEPLRIQFKMPKRVCRPRALNMMERVGLSAQWADRSAGEFSGGQRQRLAIARALILEPHVVILDEALASLDVPMQAQIVKLLGELRSSLSLSYLFITHDLRLAGSIADDIAVMRAGKIIESGSVSAVFLSPKQAYTQALLAAIPRMQMNYGQ